MTKVMWEDVQEVLKLDFNQKIDSVYAILRRSLNRKGWENLQLGKNNSVFTPKLRLGANGRRKFEPSPAK